MINSFLSSVQPNLNRLCVSPWGASVRVLVCSSCVQLEREMFQSAGRILIPIRGGCAATQITTIVYSPKRLPICADNHLTLSCMNRIPLEISHEITGKYRKKKEKCKNANVICINFPPIRTRLRTWGSTVHVYFTKQHYWEESCKHFKTSALQQTRILFSVIINVYFVFMWVLCHKCHNTYSISL